MIPMESIVKFVESYRGNSRAFRSYSRLQIMQEIVDAMRSNAFGIVTDDQQHEILGIVTGKTDSDYKILHVRNLLIKPGYKALKELAKLWHLKYGQFGWNIQGYRDDENTDLVRYFNNTRFTQLLCKLSR